MLFEHAVLAFPVDFGTSREARLEAATLAAAVGLTRG